MLQNAPPLDLLQRLLDDTDRFAVENVQAGRGGPFGASIHIYEPETARLTQIGALAANAVLSKGIGSAHAENEAISPESITALEAALENCNPETVQVIMSSSGQSCPACTAKEEILARHLIWQGLITPKNFIVTYGATYRDTLEIARFNDEPYKLDMSLPERSRMIAKKNDFVGFVPRDISRVFSQAADPVAVVARDKKILGVGYDTRAQDNDIILTAEVSAIRAASLAAKEAGKEIPWDLGGATLYTSTETMGPLAYAECQWSNVTNWVTVAHGNDNKFQTVEARGISNRDLFRTVASPDETLSDAITVIRIEPFANLAQHAWREKLDSEADPSKILYNGIENKPEPGPV